MLTRQDKTRLVIELYQQEKTIREIAKQVHMSFGDISSIIKKEFPEDQQITKETEVLKALAKGDKPLDIAIKFNLSANEVERLHREYRTLAGMDGLSRIYRDVGADLEHFVQFYTTMKKQNLSSEDIIKAVRFGNDVHLLDLKSEKKKEEIMRLGVQKQNLISETENLDNVVSVSRSVIANLNQVIDQKTKDVSSLDCRRKKLAGGLLEFMESKEYKKIKDIARQQIETTLMDKRPLLLVALNAVIEAFKLDPEKQILLSTAPSYGDYHQFYLEHQKKELLELAEYVHNELVNNLVNVTVNSVFGNQSDVSSINHSVLF